MAARILADKGIHAMVIDMHTIKPFDKEIVMMAARKTRAIVTSEEHNIVGGLGAAVAEAVTSEYPVPVIRHGVEDVFGHSGKADELMVRYGLTAENLALKAEKAISMKG